MTRINPIRKKDIRELAESISEYYFNGSAIEPELIAKVKGISFSYNNYDDIFDGLLEYKNGQFHIYCNCPDGNKANPRVRFTFSHELGHYFIDDHRNFLLGNDSYKHLSYTDKNSDSVSEQEADYFASCLLMPSKRIKDLIGKKDTKLEEILTIARSFNTSITSSAIKFIEYNSAEVALIKWNPNKSSWFFKSRNFEKLNLGYFQTDFNQLVSNSATEKAFKSRSKDIYKTGSIANIWFPSTTNSIKKNLILIEEALSLGKYGVITLIYPDVTNI